MIKDPLLAAAEVEALAQWWVKTGRAPALSLGGSVGGFG